MSMRRSKVCFLSLCLLRKSLTLTFHSAASVDKELVVTAPQFDDPNIDPDAVPLGERCVSRSMI